MAVPDQLTQIPGYEVIDLIDVGGFSRVYRGIQLSMDRPVAIKVLNMPFHDDRQRRAFERECRVMGQLSTHPNIVTVYDSAMAANPGGDLPAIVMELYTGTYRTAGRLSVPEVVDVGVKIADALDHVHRQDIVHRDLKPHNLFRSQHGEPAIADFGISTFGGEHTTGARFTLKYAPPELLREGIAGASGDIYSLGATLYQLAAGRVPFDGADEAEIVRQVMVADPPPLARSDAPPELDRLLARCLAKHPGGRPATAGQVADEFRRIQGLLGYPSRPAQAAVPPAPGPSAAPPPRESGDHTLARTGARQRVAEPRPGETEGALPGAAPTAQSRRWLLIGGLVAAAVIAAAAVGIAFNVGGGEAAPPGPTTATTVRGPAFEVLMPPTEFAVELADDGYLFTWAGGKVQIHRVGSQANVIADESPFTWRVAEPAAGMCFEARSVDAAETRLSQTATAPVCV